MSRANHTSFSPPSPYKGVHRRKVKGGLKGTWSPVEPELMLHHQDVVSATDVCHVLPKGKKHILQIRIFGCFVSEHKCVPLLLEKSSRAVARTAGAGSASSDLCRMNFI